MRYILILFLIFVNLSANASLKTKITNLIGYNSYQTNKNLINYIFKDTSNLYNVDGSVNYQILSQKLQENNLLKLKFPNVRTFNATFTIKGEQKKALIILKDVLKKVGFYNLKTSSISKTDNQIQWSLKLKGQAAINPLRLSKQLQNIDCNIIDIRQEGKTNWFYTLDFQKAKLLKVEDLIQNSSLNLKKPQKAYMIEIQGANAILINSKNGNHWHPYITFYDEELQIIEIIKENSLHNELRVEVPLDTKYIKITDIFTLANIKRGLSITKE